jgi:deoxycytidine triphosphate deaminase
MIKAMIKCGILLERADLIGVKSASYDLLLGDEYYYGGKIKKLSDSDPFLTIEPYDYAIVSCKEIACMPRDVMAKFGLTVGLFCQGIILSNGPQIDPGFRGTLFCLLFNTSNRAVHLKRGKHYATIEFNKLIEPAQPYGGQYQGSEKIIEYIPANALNGAINELKKEIESLKRESKTMQNIYLGVVGLMFAIISILLVLR